MSRTTKTVKNVAGNSRPGEGNFLTRALGNFCLLSFIIPFLLYAAAIGNYYNMDDELVTQNHRSTSKGLSGIPEILTSLYYQDEQGYAYDYRPVVLVTFAIEHQFFGDNPQVGHFINALLYGLMCFLLYRCLRRLFAGYSYILSFFITMLFAAHPAHVEVVASLKNRDEILAFIFAILALRGAIIFTATGNYWRLLVVAAYFAVGLLSKPSVVSFMFIIPVVLLSTGRFLRVFMVFVVLLACLMVISPLSFQIGVSLIAIAAGVAILYHRDILGFLNQYSALKAPEASTAPKTKKAEAKSDTMQLRLSMVNILLFLLCVYWGTTLLMLPIVFALLLFAFGSSTRVKSINLAMVLAGIAVANYVYDLKGTFFIGLLLAGMAYYNAGSRKEKWWPLAGFIVLVASVFPDYKIMAGGAALFGLFVARTEIKTRVFDFVVLIGLFVVLLYSSFYSGSFKFHPGHILVPLIAVYFFVNTGMRKSLSLGFYVMLALILFSKQHSLAPATADATKVNSVSDMVATKADRPLDFIEAPVTVHSPLTVRLGTSLVICGRYLQKMIAPYPLSFYYGYKYIQPASVWGALPLLSLAFHLLLALLCLYSFRTNWLLFTGLSIYLISIASVSNFFFSIPGMMGDRFMLIPSLGFCITVIAFLGLAFKIDWKQPTFTLPRLGWPAKLIVLFIFLGYSGLTVARSLLWKDDLTLMRHDITRIEESAQAHNLLASHLLIQSFNLTDSLAMKKMRREALGHLNSALDIYPGFYNAAYYQAQIYLMLDKPDSAIMAYKTAIAIDSTDPGIYGLVADLYYAQHKLNEAAPYYEHLIIANPTDYKGYDNLSYLYFVMHDYERSVAVSRLAIDRMPNKPEPYLNLARTYFGTMQPDSALKYLNKTLQIDPGNKDAQGLLKQFKY